MQRVANPWSRKRPDGSNPSPTATQKDITVLITREKCPYADKYKGIRKPTCCCRACMKIWEDKNKTGVENSDVTGYSDTVERKVIKHT